MLAGRFQGRYLIATGWLLLTFSMFLSTRRIDLLISFNSATLLRIAQYAPLGLVFIPTTAAAYYGMPKDKNNAVAGLVNFMRNIGAKCRHLRGDHCACAAQPISPGKAGQQHYCG